MFLTVKPVRKRRPMAAFLCRLRIETNTILMRF